MTEPVKTPPNTSNDLSTISKENILKAVKATNLCFTHMKYHGQQSKECEVQERTVIEFAPNTSDEALSELDEVDLIMKSSLPARIKRDKIHALITTLIAQEKVKAKWEIVNLARQRAEEDEAYQLWAFAEDCEEYLNRTQLKSLGKNK